jgi:hypothetical protein
VDNNLVEQIVANVLAELQPKVTVRAPTPPVVQAETAVVDVDLPVITAEILAERLRPGQTVRIGRRSILTPSARDWLAARKISCTRISGVNAASMTAASRWHVVVTAVTPAVATLRQSLAGWKTELLGTPKEAAEYAVRVLCTGEADGVLGLCHAAESVACLANRHPKVRAAVLAAPGDLQELIAQLGPNLLVVNPRGKSFVDLRNLLRSVGGLGKPKEPPLN